MNQRLRWKGLWFGFVLFAFITSCAPIVQDAPALDASPSPESADISFEVTYD